jgi:hypothetical protein
VPLAARGIPMGVTQQHGHPNLERQSLAHFVKLARLGFVFRVPTGKLAGHIRPHVFVNAGVPIEPFSIRFGHPQSVHPTALREIRDSGEIVGGGVVTSAQGSCPMQGHRPPRPGGEGMSDLVQRLRSAPLDTACYPVDEAVDRIEVL